MAQSKAFVDASHSLNELSHALALLESENSSLRGAVDGFTSDNAKLRELCKAWRKFSYELFDEFIGEPEASDDFMELDDRMREMGVEVGE